MSLRSWAPWTQRPRLTTGSSIVLCTLEVPRHNRKIGKVLFLLSVSPILVIVTQNSGLAGKSLDFLFPTTPYKATRITLLISRFQNYVTYWALSCSQTGNNSSNLSLFLRLSSVEPYKATSLLLLSKRTPPIRLISIFLKLVEII